MMIYGLNFRPQRSFKIFASAALAMLAQITFAFEADTPVTPGASREAQALMTFFADIYGRNIISGQQDGWQRTNGLSHELNYIQEKTGKLPALLAMDITAYTDRSPRRDGNHRLAGHAIDWYQNRHGLVEFCWHWRAPLREPAFYTKETTFDITRAVTPGTPEYEATLRDLDLVAAELEVLRDAHVPVLWRPLHEANGRWFWWGAGGPEPMKKLWRLMFENFTARHHLDNLIWVFSPGAETDLADWYPGDAFVDIIGQDHYPMDGNHGPAKDVFDELVKFSGGKKLVALGENGPVPDIKEVIQTRAGWLFFTTWTGSILFEKTTPTQLREYYNNPYVLNLGDLPDLSRYPLKPIGKATKLGFAGTPEDVAIGGTRRLPVTLAVQDQDGKTVRSGTYSVTLQLDKTHNGTLAGTLAGTLTTSTVNGIATFPDVKMNTGSPACQLMAVADGLQSASSRAFQVGPGTGLRHEWWLGRDDFSASPDGREIWGQALESPVRFATNFLARTSGVLIAPQTGAYKFWLDNAGTSELWLSPDDSPANKVRIAAVTTVTPYRKWPHINEAESQAVQLVAGQKYYLELRQKQPGGSTQLHVRWQLPDGTEERPIPAFHFLATGDSILETQTNQSASK